MSGAVLTRAERIARLIDLTQQAMDIMSDVLAIEKFGGDMSLNEDPDRILVVMSSP